MIISIECYRELTTYWQAHLHEIHRSQRVQWVCPRHGVYTQAFNLHVYPNGEPYRKCKRCAQSRIQEQRWTNTERRYKEYMSRLEEKIAEDKDYLVKHNYQYNKQGKLVRVATMGQDKVDWYKTNVLGGDIIDPGQELMDYIKRWKDDLESYLVSLGDPFIKDYAVNNQLIVDFYFPDKKVAIDFIDFYHNAFLRPGQWKDLVVRTQLQDKWMYLTLNKGLRYIAVFDEVWQQRRPRIESIIRYAVHPATYRYFARKCDVVKLDTKVSNEFFKKYHADGTSSLAVARYGLVPKGQEPTLDNLLQVMSFSMPRMGRDPKGSYEIARMACKSDHMVVGGSSRLIQAFAKEYHPRMLKTYYACTWFKGEGYIQAGMEPDTSFTPPSYGYLRYCRDTGTVTRLPRECNQVHRMRQVDPELAADIDEHQAAKDGKYVAGFEYACASAWNEYGSSDCGNGRAFMYWDKDGNRCTREEWEADVYGQDE